MTVISSKAYQWRNSVAKSISGISIENGNIGNNGVMAKSNNGSNNQKPAYRRASAASALASIWRHQQNGERKAAEEISVMAKWRENKGERKWRGVA